MSSASIDPRVLRTAKWFANNGWTINVNHGDGVVEAAMPRRDGEAPVVVNVIALVAAVVAV
jgi:hypothetical protein